MIIAKHKMGEWRLLDSGVDSQQAQKCRRTELSLKDLGKVKKYISLVLRLVVAVAGIAYIAWSLTWTDSLLLPSGYELWDGYTVNAPTEYKVISENASGYEIDVNDLKRELYVPLNSIGKEATDVQYRPGIVTTLKDADYSKLWLGLILIGIMFPIQGIRWWILMKCRGLEVPKLKAVRLTLVGLFFNFCMPGMTGGDVVKAYYAAKGSGRRGVAVMSVVFDRIAGLFGLIILGGVVGLFMLDNELARQITIGIWILIVSITIMGIAYFSQRIRQLLGIKWLMDRMGEENIFARLDHATVAYRHHKGAVASAIAISLPVHLCQVTAVAVAGYALGMQIEWGLMYMVLPVIFLAGSLPISYQGLGVMEGLGFAFLATSDLATNNQVVGMLVLMRIFFVIYAVLSSILVLRGNVHLFPQEEAAEEAS
ncbi:flippase-like domain-containing protein [Planctomycetota bacterium]|nr:flippase-like domain-containing protein [Planctomycetota bacterium]